MSARSLSCVSVLAGSPFASHDRRTKCPAQDGQPPLWGRRRSRRSRGTFDPSEQLGLAKRYGERREVEGDKVLIVQRAVVLNGSGDQLFAGARYDIYQKGAVHWQHEIDGRKNRSHRRPAADDVFEEESAL